MNSFRPDKEYNLDAYYLVPVPTLEYSTTGTRGIEEEDCRSKNMTRIDIVDLISLR
jgi:hypothetical protein